MKEKIKMLDKYNLSFIYLNIMITLLILIPKSNFGLDYFPIRIVMMFGYILLVLIDYKKKLLKFNKNKWNIFSIIFMFFIVFCIPSLFVTESLFTSIYTICKFILSYVMFLFILKTSYNDSEINILTKNIMISSITSIIYGIICYFFSINLFTESNYLYPGMLGRTSSIFFNPIYFGIYTNLFYPLVLYGLCMSKGKKNILYIVLLIILYISLLFTFTRSALIIFLVISVLSLFLLRKKIFNYKTLVVAICMIMLTICIPGAKKLFLNSISDGVKIINNFTSFIPGFELDEYNYVDYDENSDFTDYSLQHRESFARIAKEIGNDNLFTGVGLGAYIDYMNSDDFASNYPEYALSKTHPHSSFVLLFAEAGIISVIFMFIFMIMILLYFIRNIFILRKEKDVRYYCSSLGFLITIGFLVVNIISENAIYDTQIFPLYLIFTGLLMMKSKINNKDKKILFISSTGGHLVELMHLKEMFSKYDYHIVTEKTPSNVNLKNKHPNRVSFLLYGTYTKIIDKIIYPFKLIINTFISLYIYIKVRPEYIISTGAHTAGPICLLGKILGSKIVFIETFANSKTKTKTGRIVYLFADLFIVQWEEMLKLYPNAVYGGWIF